ncbi:hypothetical protein [Pseudobacteriovorax antillogorgiicola]|uniref:Uncharacterized protein n=1 Tax=Pseudobacteriovorax antillogorgiicola TaxID=1513793 RepID=A0A1Y6CQ58_9BACT|nr:hypothetical protein [Pseudobacteriovorax antillogorgiicola]TCS47014.1 hypothetical protein EDD56_122109 [Pseudobacteriovorax antillogorgiicola]SMF65087.1 hypothetical protein SAMN06296036_122109 [Pseudobacteriovorax antillogorgiicola]
MIKDSLTKTILFIIYGLGSGAFGETVRHTIQVDDSITSILSQGNCGYIDLNREACLPGTFFPNRQFFMGFDIFIRAKEQAITDAYQLVTNDIDGEYVSKIFKDRSYDDGSALVRLAGQYDRFTISYSPYQLLGSYKMDNPAYPEVSLAGLKQSELRVSYRDQLAMSDEITIHTYVSLYRFNRKFYSLESSLPLLLLDDEVELNSRRKVGFNGDVGLNLAHKSTWLPHIGVLIKNLASERHCWKCDQNLLDIESNFKQVIDISLSKFIATPYGRFMAATHLPVQGYDFNQSRYDWSHSLAYVTPNLQAFLSSSALKSSLGLILSTNNYRLGIQFSNEKQANRLQIERQQRSNVFLSYQI